MYHTAAAAENRFANETQRARTGPLCPGNPGTAAFAGRGLLWLFPPLLESPAPERLLPAGDNCNTAFARFAAVAVG